jgi:aldehyde:ferredoxin oxidoreductase
MIKGYNNKVLCVDLTRGELRTEEPGEVFFRQYLGGGGLGVWYGLRQIPPHTDPLSPDNVLVFATGVITGSPVMAASRFSVSAKSPITGGFGDSQGGGFFGPSLKYAGFDAVVFTGKSPKPVYLLVKDGKAELKDAQGIWGMTTKDYEAALREQHGRETVVAGIGPAGERLCRFACIINERKHANGRLGMGAVMGSKNLKCIAAIGQKPAYEYADSDELRKWARYAGNGQKTVLYSPG